jgi:diguanylate cyclase (GGDEF)-like protein
MDRAEQLLARARRGEASPAALFIDLDGFKGINDTLGHATGDELLTTVGSRLRAAVRDGDTIGRLGGDEFVVLIENNGQTPRAELVAQRVLEVLREPLVLPATDSGYTVTASIGIAEGLRATADDLLRDADLALYEAKAAGRDCYVVFAAKMTDAVHGADRDGGQGYYLSRPMDTSATQNVLLEGHPVLAKHQVPPPRTTTADDRVPWPTA